MAFLRLLLHCPKLAFLDEASGALDTPTEAALYTALRSHCSSFVSVGELSQAYLVAGTHCLHTDNDCHPCKDNLKCSSAAAWTGHRSELVRFHTHVLENVNQGKWVFSTVDAYQSRHQLR